MAEVRRGSPDGRSEGAAEDTGPRKVLTPAAERALAEAAMRRAAASDITLEKELGGRKEGLEPTRYGDWENKGLLSDF
jgi:hypothetical protein